MRDLGKTALAVLAATTLAAASLSQEPSDPAAFFGETVDVRLVNVEAWVTDRKGNPVKGLTVEDFELLEDGKPVEITHFAEVRDEEPVAAPAPSPEAATPSEDASGREVATPAIWPSHMVLYFDDLHLSPSSRKRIIKDLQGFLESGSLPAERILIMRQEDELYTEVPFGSSRVQLADALDRIASEAPRGVQVQQEKRLAIRRLQEIYELEAARGGPGAGAAQASDPCDTFFQLAVIEVEIFTRQSLQRTAISLDHLRSVVSFLAGVPGVKTLLYLSDRLETTPGADLVGFVHDLCPTHPTTGEFSYGEGLALPFRELTRHASANRVTVYAIQGSGLGSGAMFSADQAAVRHHQITGFQTAMRTNERQGMSVIAAETGGRAVFNRNRFDGELEQIRNEMGSYYSLAYSPGRPPDGLDHQIKVRLKPDGLSARHRRGFRDKGADEQMGERLLSALYLGQVMNPLGLRLGQGPVVGRSRGGYSLPLHVLVPPDRVAYIPVDGVPTAQLKVQILARNARGDRTAEEERLFRIEQPPADYDRPLDLMIELRLEEGLQMVAVAVRDEATREASYVSTTFEIAISSRASR